ncbi:MAG TPA: hypothetical protein DCG12_00925 [Planctomycetaceae bacterium]|nr:hypothetical protein [Planctomycetaceae bacterium]
MNNRLNIKSSLPILLSTWCLSCEAPADESSQADTNASPVTVIRLQGDSMPPLAGAVRAEAADGSVLIETADSVLHLIKPVDIAARSSTTDTFRHLDRKQMAAQLLRKTGNGFRIEFGDNHIVCSDASELFTQYCVRLLNKTTAEYSRFFADSETPPRIMPDNMSVILFRTQSEFQAYAQKQHPDTDFSDVPGYYSVRDNQMLIAAAAGDRDYRGAGDVLRKLKSRLRLVETVVHEAVHQLAFNSGLQTRYADTPVWLSEGLAVYFERASGTGQTLWIRPGGVSRIHLRGFKAAAASDHLAVPLADLFSSDNAFGTNPAAAYAESWAVIYFLARRDRAALDRLLKSMPTTPMGKLAPQQRLKLIQDATGRSIEDLEKEVLRYMKTVRQR